MHFCPNKKCMDPLLKLDNDPIQFVKEAKKLHFLVWIGIQNSPLNLISNIWKQGVKNLWTSWKSSLVQNGMQIELHYWNYIAPLLDQNWIMVV